ncbi:hormogonium polysaccharide biosynthesis protein HpsA [Trichocoleus sp. FACHB-262]|uniref:hormogonium polysaccharide biosynthesis protein HpsA n=1 Tax=Trichocoleus sp. FACHB-262 TaxID=2692869 RepID=UPI0016874DE0|nr:hormogonium polysaccharide biosynthesis protein HpsA [Trichocoleus sp. FACHB-262]MBD2121177.1 hypothetical protein [Trichocoleus sp. FACHB-262]
MPTRKPATHNKLTNWLLRSLLVVGQRSRLSNTGFVLPTVVMVTLVVVLLTTALVIRSFDRSRNASNTRVNEVSLNASSPAIDRAKAKLNALFEDPTLPRATPSDTALYRAIRTSTKYTFGDETRLKIGFDLNNPTAPYNGAQIQPNAAIENDETSTTAWRFPVDTDNNGKFDSYTLYGVFFRSPTRDPATGNFNRARTPLEARTPPMDDSSLGGQCANALGTSASLVGDSGWYKAGGKLKKSFFVYTATVPITSAAGLGNTFESYKGNRGFSALEFQQDRGRIPLSNNAVVYEDDLQITPGPGLKLNGRVFTNSNLLIRRATGSGTGDVKLYQVSSKNSCYYEEETGKIVVGGNVGSGAINSTQADETASGDVNVHLFQGKGENPDLTKVINGTNKTTTNAPRDIAYNSQAYIDRVNFLVDSAISRGGQTVGGTPGNYTVTSVDPTEIKNNIQQRLNNDASLDPAEVRRQELETYFRQRTRRVPFLEVPFGANALFVGGTTYNANTPTAAIFPGVDPLRPPNTWMFPTDPANNMAGTGGYTGLTLATQNGGATLQPPMLSPLRKGNVAKELLLGDRLMVGNNVAEILFDGAKFLDVGATQPIPNVSWNNDTGGTNTAAADNPRKRTALVSQLADLGITDRDGFWEKAAAERPVNVLDNIGGLRVVTGAGIYSTDRNPAAGVESSFLPAPTQATYDDPNTATVEAFPVVWPDSMPMWQDTNNNGTPDLVNVDKRGDLVMRATAVYHFQDSAYNPNAPATYQTPIACVSSYYDPSTSTTASNAPGLPSGVTVPTGGRSNSGISYGPPGTTAATLAAGGVLTNAVFTSVAEPIGGGDLRAKLNYQANLVYPSGRFVNEPLRKALISKDAGRNLTLAEQSAIDSAVCALEIKAGKAPDPSKIPHGTIRETTFLNAEQVKSIDRDLLSNISVTGVTAASGNKAYTVSFAGTLAELQALLPVSSAITIRGFVNQQLNSTKGEVTSISGAGPTYTINVAGIGAGTASGSAKIVEALTGKYDLSIEERQPLEVRATVLDLERLRTTTIGGATPAQEYLLPNSGIIYASRDDALSDLSAPLSTATVLSDAQKAAAQKSRSPVDFKLDPSRRPSAILLENGANLSRTNNYRAEEKGLILASNVPAYIKGNFNLHTGGTGQEFNETLTGAWGDADFYNRSTPNPQFACRPGQFGPGSCSPGDTWRPATILADSVSLLSESFRYGFRDEGGYDLRNNQDYVADAKTKRKSNGFWDNDFAINGLSSGGITAGITDSSYHARTSTAPNSSYFNNFVTPIQRRGDFPEYVMEVCTKVVISECGPNDWNINPATNLKASSALDQPFDIAIHKAGTTAQPAAAEYQRYPRRIAVLRKASNKLIFTEPALAGRASPIPLGVCGPSNCPSGKDGRIWAFPYTGTYTSGTNNFLAYAGANKPRNAGNALWYRTSSDANDPTTRVNDITTDKYDAGRPLQYSADSTLLLPETVCVKNTAGVGSLTDCPTAWDNSVANLNLPLADKASSYAVCVPANNAGATKRYQSGEANFTGTCPGNNTNTSTVSGVINQSRLILGAITSPAPIATGPANAGAFTANGGDLTATAGVNVYTLPSGGFNNGAVITLKPRTISPDPNAIFILKAPSGSFNFGANNCTGCNGVKLVLDGGIDENNVFWLLDNGAVKFQDVDGTPHELKGTIFADNLQMGNKAEIEGRLYGSANAVQFTNGSTSKVVAVVGSDQPRFTPVLQLQATTNGPGNQATDTIMGGSSTVSNTKWLPPTDPAGTTYNVVVASGDTPGRVGANVPTTGEPGPGLPSFVHLLENWSGVNNNISGSFIQFKRSAFVTAPAQPLFNIAAYNASSLFGYPQGYRTGNSPGAGNSADLGKIPFYEPPNRNWGFDVALLTQLPDLFSQRFTLPPAGAPDEFFREVGRDDRWVEALMCAAAAGGDGKGGPGATYTNYAIPDSSQRPARCQTNATANYPAN